MHPGLWLIRIDTVILKIPKVKDEISSFSERYLNRLSNHPNILAINLLDDSDEIKRLQRFHILDLPYRK